MQFYMLSDPVSWSLLKYKGILCYSLQEGKREILLIADFLDIQGRKSIKSKAQMVRFLCYGHSFDSCSILSNYLVGFLSETDTKKPYLNDN